MKALVIRVQDDNTLKLAADLLKHMGCDVEEIEVAPEGVIPICIVCGSAEGELRQQVGGGMRTVRLAVGQAIHGQQICTRCLEDARGRARGYKTKKEPKPGVDQPEPHSRTTCDGCLYQGDKEDMCGSCTLSRDHYLAAELRDGCNCRDCQVMRREKTAAT